MTQGQWHPDPTGRHELRFWDGRAWTAHVSDGGVTSQDPPAWPPAPPATGLGLGSGSLWYQCGDGRAPWAVVDADGAMAGWVIPPGAVRIGPQQAALLDAGQQRVLTVDQDWLSGARILVDGQTVALVRGAGGAAYTVVIGGRLRLRLAASLAGLHAGPVAVTDPGGSPVATLAMRWNPYGQVDFHLGRLTTFPAGYDHALLSLPVAMTLDLDARAAASAATGGYSAASSRYWPGL